MINRSIHYAFRFLIPLPDDRLPVTYMTGSLLGLLFIPYFILAYLARRPNTHLLRLALLPIAIACQLAFGFKFSWPVPEYKAWNWGDGEFDIYHI